MSYEYDLVSLFLLNVVMFMFGRDRDRVCVMCMEFVRDFPTRVNLITANIEECFSIILAKKKTNLSKYLLYSGRGATYNGPLSNISYLTLPKAN